jgi:phage baseplate assembly protein V
MFRVGIVKVQDAQNCRVRLSFGEHDDMCSYWLPVVSLKTQSDKFYWVPDIGEQVVCFMDEHDEDGAVLGAIYSSPDSPPVQDADKVHCGFKDGAAFEYDRATHVLAVSVPASGIVTIKAGEVCLSIDGSGDVRVVAAGHIQLGGGELKGVARLGDSVSCPAGTGTIISASTNVMVD